MNTASIRVAAGFVTALALGIFTASSVFASDGDAAVSFAPFRDLSASHGAPPVIDGTFSAVSREDSGVRVFVHTTLPEGVTPAGHPARIDVYILNNPEQCHNAGAPFAMCTGQQLRKGIGDPHVVTLARDYPNEAGRLNVHGRIPTGASLKNPLGAELWIVVSTYHAGHGYAPAQISFQDPGAEPGNQGS